ncbi:MAG: hypothetical protein LUD51_07370 [Clostridia bacterium]|nr:hypothetical protein [Clostridia bacterium]
MKDFTGTVIQSKKYGQGTITGWNESITKDGRRFKALFPSVAKEIEFTCPLAFAKALMTGDADLLAQIEADRQAQKDCAEDFAMRQENIQQGLQKAGEDNLSRYRSSGTPVSGSVKEDDTESGKAEVYGMHITEDNSALEKDGNGNGHICIGWHELGDLSGVSSREELKEMYSRIWPGRSSGAMSTDVGEIWTFIAKMKPGDVVVLFDSQGYRRQVAHFGIVISDYYFKEDYPGDADYVHNREVKWIQDCTYDELKDDTFINSLDSTLTATLSIWSLEKYRDQIAKLLDKIYDINA